MYHLEGDRKSWLDAQKHCREKYTDLATVDNTEDMDRLMHMTSGSYDGFAWIGMYDDLFRSWRWSLEDEVIEGAGEYRNWDSAQDNTGQGEHCVATVYGAWLAFSCKTLIRFICYDGEHWHYIHIHTYTYSGENKYLTSCRFRKFGHLQRNA